MSSLRPSLFIGSSAEGRLVAQALQILLDHACKVTIWSQGVFGISEGTLESLIVALDESDFAVLVLTPDDVVTSRGSSAHAPRDNVVFELGLFMGALGRQRTYLVHDRTAGLKLPSDLAGITLATYEVHSSERKSLKVLRAALGAAAAMIEEHVGQLRFRARSPSGSASAIEQDDARNDIRIQTPSNNQRVGNRVRVEGTHEGVLVDTANVVLIEYVPSTRHFWFKGQPTFEADGNWGADIWLGGDPEEQRQIMIAMLGKAGRALYDYDNAVKAATRAKKIWIGVPALTPDIHKLDEVTVTFIG
jgi:hypothetical protein